MKYRIKYVLIFIAILLLSSCSILSPIKSAPRTTYLISKTPDYIPKRYPQAGTLLVLPPETNPAYNSMQMAYTTKPYQISYYALNQWAETPSQMLKALIIQTLQKTHYFHAITTPPYTGRYNYILRTQIIELVQDYKSTPSVARLTISVQLIQASNNRIIGTKQLSAAVPMYQASPYNGVLATNRATAIVLKQLASYCLQRVY